MLSKLFCKLWGHSFFTLTACDKRVYVACRRCLKCFESYDETETTQHVGDKDE